MGKEARGFGLPWAKKMGLGYRGQKSFGFGLPWAKLVWVWATTGTTPPAGLGYRGQKLLGFGLPRAKNHFGLGDHGQNLPGFGLLSTIGTEPPRVWATVGGEYLGLGYRGQK